MNDNRGGHTDRVSNLPSNVIDGILQQLPIRDVIRTSILSKKWRYMWVSVPRLYFDRDCLDKCYERNIKDPEIASVITEILFLHNGPVSEFTVMIPCYHSSVIACLSKWILFLSKNGIKYLDLLNCGDHPYQMSSHLFSCLELTYLELDQFKLSVPPNFCGFNSLLELHLSSIGFESGVLERLISCCPVLNKLTIELCDGFDCIHVSAPSLKVLCIEGDEDIKSICFKKAKNLTDLTLIMETDLTLIMETHGEKFEQFSVSDFLKALPKIERLCLRGEYYIKMMSTGTVMQTLQKSIKLKYLELDGVDFNQSRNILFIVSLLKSSSMLVELVIKEAELVIESSSVAEAPSLDHLMVLYCNSCCLSQLQKVNITVRAAYEHALDLTQFLLANSSSLEILTFKIVDCSKQLDTPTLLNISRVLLQMKRASQIAEVEFLYDEFD